MPDRTGTGRLLGAKTVRRRRFDGGILAVIESCPAREVIVPQRGD